MTAQATSSQSSQKKKIPFWIHFIGGGLGGTTASVVTCPLEVVKTRLQGVKTNPNLMLTSTVGSGSLGLHPTENPFGTRIISIIRSILQNEGITSLWKGVGPNLIGVAPARAVHFMSYSQAKSFFGQFEIMKEKPSLQNFLSATLAGTATVTITSPIWLVKTRMQLQVKSSSADLKQYKNTIDCFVKVYREEGFRSFYRGMVASYVGISETALQFVLYEKFKLTMQQWNFDENIHQDVQSVTLRPREYLLVASLAKLIASVTTYPHEVVRTRMREQRLPTDTKYKNFLQALHLIAKEEGRRGLYGGMGVHLLRVVPNAAIMFFIYESVVKIYEQLYLDSR